ncbi:MAG: carotenoid biosynthesis protein [Ignavibacteria bacterium]|nr:carotenoid biosynthesis protein [Ignavibacteria bacterium]
MEGQKTVSDRSKAAIIYIIYIVGIAGHLSDAARASMITLTPYVLIITGFLILIFSKVFNNKKFLIWFLISYLITLLLEIAGIRTGLIFGEYIYGDVLGFTIAGVPLIIGFNWIFVILGGIGIGSKISGNKISIAVIAGITAVIFDYVLEPAAVRLNYWSWLSGEIPLQNYLAWYLITFLISLMFSLFKINISFKFFIHYIIAQFIFFLILNSA